MKPGEIQFIDMMRLRGWEYQARPEKKTYETWEFTNTHRAYDGQPARLESVNVDTALFFRKNDGTLIINLERERVVHYNGWPSTAAKGMSAPCMSLNAFYADIDNICGDLTAPKPITPRDPKIVWQALRATIG